jgi:DUF4097 and DUF4098 domain-containing protein YvlB
MSNPAPLPVLPPPRRRRSLAGPVVLIVMGIVFLMGTMGVLHFYMLGHLFARYWPVLIILWGVVKLIEHQQAQRDGVRSPGIGVGGVFLMIFLIIAGLTATQASRVNWKAFGEQIGWDDEDFFHDLSEFGPVYTYDDQIEQSFPAGTALHVVSDRGAVRIESSDEDKIRIVVNKRLHADNQQDADKYNRGTKPLVTVGDKVVTVNANTQGAGDHGVSTDLTITIPRNVAVMISTRRGDVKVTDRNGNVDVSAQHGDVTLDEITGNAHLNLEHNSAKVTNISGDVSVEGRVNDVTISDVKGAVRLNGEFQESVRLSNISKAVSFRSARTDLEFSRLEGDLDLDSGDLRANALSGPAHLITKSKDITLDSVSGDLRLEDSNGAVQVNVRKLGNLQLENRNGDIQVSLPAQATFKVDARARNGEIQSDFGELQIENAHDMATATGTVGNGGPLLRLTNEQGTIEIHKGTTQAAAPEVPTAPRAPHAPHAPKAPTEPTEN